jgi:hypothetical protein
LSLLSIFIAIGAEKTGRQLANDPDTKAAERLRIPNEADNKIEVVDNKAQGMRDAMQDASDRARHVDEAQALVNEIERIGTDCTIAIPDNLFTVLLSVSYILGTENMDELMSSECHDPRGWLSHYRPFLCRR